MNDAAVESCKIGVDKGLTRAISPNELMYDGDEEHYFRVGRSALDCIKVALQATRRDTADVKAILDLPCGHGRVTRYLRLAFPNAEITACDLLRDGVDFCASNFGAIPVYSRDDPREIPLEPEAFNLIWVGSLFTHLDAGAWSDFLNVFHSLLQPGGVLVFTTHGRQACQRMRESDFYGLFP